MKKQYVNYYQYLKLQSRALDPQKPPEIGERFGIGAIILHSFLKLILYISVAEYGENK